MENENLLLFVWGTAVVLVLWRSYKYAMQMIECAAGIAAIVAIAVFVHWIMLSTPSTNLRELGLKGVGVINEHVSKLPTSSEQAYSSFSQLFEQPTAGSPPGVFQKVINFAVQKITPAPLPTTGAPTPPPETGVDAVLKWASEKLFKKE